MSTLNRGNARCAFEKQFLEVEGILCNSNRIVITLCGSGLDLDDYDILIRICYIYWFFLPCYLGDSLVG